MPKYFWELIVGTLLIGLIVWAFQLLKEYENRLTKLETKFEDCIDCSQRIRKIGDYPYTTFTGVDVDTTGEILLKADIDLLSEQFRWKCASITEIVRGYNPEDLGKVISKYKDDAELKNALGIVCVGTASSEGDINGEETRAKDRIETLINLVNSNLTSEKRLPIYGMNFGKFKESRNTPCSNATLDQRRIVLVKIIERSEKLTDDKLEASLKRLFLAKASNPNISFPIDIRQYSMFNSGQPMLVYGRRNDKL